MNDCECAGECKCLILKDTSSKSYCFREVKLGPINPDSRNPYVFEDYGDTTLKELKDNPGIFKGKYTEVIKNFYDNHKDLYCKYKSYEIGKALKLMKRSNENIYKEFLKNYGDEEYCEFEIEGEPEIDGKKIKDLQGLYCFSIDDKSPTYIGGVAGKTTNYKKCIRDGHGRISSVNCYLHGQSTHLRTNSKINKYSQDSKYRVSFWVHPMERREEINKLKDQLLARYKYASYYWRT